MGDVEIIGRGERRRKWTPEEKAALLSEIEAEGGRVIVVARRHRISESSLYNWCSAWRAAASRAPSGSVISIRPRGATGVSASANSTRAKPGSEGACNWRRHV
jgi:transposase